ncbi:alanine--tRNA ligase [Amnibacterium kyonggiense]|uniref:Alanine--tRNA ligase n=1 Tax=Amnibacterium kyonggiense TaxID=595671 RepID=A0A4R7FM10_9MICO|nr:alanine--tRNA ligase [Amnibacterium kyonggiense]TDS77475.1 alanyl-tRNA synthetase [Amnibacterium kyonggiense]
MKTAEIRRRYLQFFADRGHTVVPSASLVSPDPSLLFTVAGMVPFIPYLNGTVPAPYPRAVDSQKCIRTLDIEEVGRTPRHGTFFQMLGNWSFGDYFKRDAITWAWELLTSREEDGGLGFDPKDLWVTVFLDDDEAESIWRDEVGLPADRIQRLGYADNYWMTGQPGPAGPDSEIFFDRGPAYGADGGPATGDDRYVEIWNLVFMQYAITNIRSKEDFDVVGELPNKNVDTGMGLERVAFIKQGVENIYETDQIRPVIDKASELAGKAYGAVHEDDVRMRVVSDHVRSAMMLMLDGVTPSNEGRGYVLRRLLRRSVRAMRLLGVDGPTFGELFPVSRDAMADAYPELLPEFGRIQRLANAEEESFLRTLVGGENLLDTAIARTRAAGASEVAGDTAFLLHDTYGFPIDLTLEVAEEAGLTVDRGAFDRLMQEQRSRAKADAKSRKTALADLSVYSDFRAKGETTFLGYTDLVTDSRVLGLIRGGVAVDRIALGDIAEVILAETTLYAEAGGQDADQGEIVGPGYRLEVLDVQRPVAGLISHKVQVAHGEVAVGDPAETVVDPVYRRGATQAHSATHLIHAALRQVLGPDAHQAGSYNKAGYMRLDFSWSAPLSPETRSEVEDVANSRVNEDLEVVTRVLPIDEARAAGAMALFGEKYGDVVRMVDIGGPWSRELCGGIHVAHSSEIGLINVVGESSVGATSRRIESLVGPEAFKQFATERALVTELGANLRVPPAQIVSRVQDLAASLKAAEKRIAEFERQALATRVPALAAQARTVGGVTAVLEQVGDLAASDDLRNLVTDVRDRLGAAPAVVALAAAVNARPVVIVATNAAARDGGAKAGALAKRAATALGGGGGGRDDVAQGGGTDVAAIGDALDAVAQGLAS